MIKIFTVLMSLQLILAPLAMAQNSGDQFRANPDGKKSSSYMNQIGSIVIAGIGTTTMLNCAFSKLLPSIVLFNAGSLAYIASEVMGGKGQNAFHNRKMSDMEMLEEKMKGQTGGDVQKEALETALKDEKETLDIINGRKKWLNAIFAIYGLATIAALIEVIKGKIPLAQPIGQLGACNVAGMAVSTTMLKSVVVAAWTFKSLKGGEGMIGKYGSMGASIAIAFSGVGTKVAALMNPPEGRIAAFAIATALIKLNQSDLSSQARTAQENIEKLERVLAQFNQDTKTNNSTIANDQNKAGSGVTSGVGGGGGSELGSFDGSSGTQSYAIDPLANVSNNPSQNCFSNSSNQVLYSNICNDPLTIAQPGFDANINIPTLRNGTNAAVEFGNAVARGDLAGADAAASKLESLSGKLKEIEDGLKKKVNDDLVAKGEKPIDFDSERDKTFQDLQNGIIGAATANGMELAALSPSVIDTSATDATSDEEKSEINTASSQEVIAAPAANPGMGMISETGLVNDSSVSAGTTVSDAKSLEDSLKDFVTNESDISNRSEDNLFKQLSLRYQANYDRFFERKKVEVSEPTN